MTFKTDMIWTDDEVAEQYESDLIDEVLQGEDA